MNKTLFFLVFLTITAQICAQSNMPVRLALISETDLAATAADVLTAQFSSNQKIQLLERDQIAKVYREQGLSAANTDYHKLGQILGADGLLLLQTTTEGTNTFLNVRLVAVKPGVVLTAEKYSWPMTNLTEWSPAFAQHLDLFVPKLTVLVKDAIPLSVVNLRSAVASGEAGETERQLKLLTIQRLSREPQLFVLERQKMQLLTEEKELKTDDSAFWNGSYLLEGVVDQNGYSQETITINARLTPPKGGAPLQFEVSGSRTNLAEVVNRLAAKVNGALKVNSTVKEWNTANEAAQYYDEAKWALKWGVYFEAQAAADSAWALGKRDLDCALMRVKSYVSEVPPNVGGFQIGESTYSSSGYNAEGKPLGPPPSDAFVQADITKMQAQHPLGVVYKIREHNGVKIVNYVFASQQPEPQEIDHALHALELYYEFCQISPDGEPKILSRGEGWNDWRNSDWYQLGIDVLVTASSVLQHFNYVPESQKPVADKLAELRASARSVAGLISKSPSVHDSYFVGDRIATRDELAHTIEEHPNIFRCELDWGSFWQETPEGGVALYRELMSSPVFCYIHKDLWSRGLQTPRLTAWNGEDQKRIPAVWTGFVRELSDSTNVLLRMEAKALTMTDATSEEQSQSDRNDLFEIIRSNRNELVANKVELFYLGWGLGYPNAELDALDQEYWTRARFFPIFQKQKQFLKENNLNNIQGFSGLFLGGSGDYSNAQALEIQPLLAAYKSNLVAQVAASPNANNGMINFTIMQVGQAEANVNRILNPPAPIPQPPVQPQAPQPAVVAKTAVTVPDSQPVTVANAAAVPPVSNNAPKPPASVKALAIVPNILTVNKFLTIPLNDLQGDQVYDVTITAQQWLEGKLLLDFQYGLAYVHVFHGIAILDPKTEHWDVIYCPDVAGNPYFHHSTLLHSELFTCDGEQIRKYDLQNKQWQVLPVSDGNNYEIFSVNDHLYAANGNIILEIIDGGKATHILASARRQPPVSVLDARDLGTPILFEGPNHSLRVRARGKIYTWTGNDWHEDFAAPPAASMVAVSMDGVLFRNDGFNQPARVSCLATESNAVELCLLQKTGPMDNNNLTRPGANSSNSSEPLWELPPGLSLANLAAVRHRADLYLLVDHSEVKEIIDEQQHLIVGKKVVAKGGYHAALLCFSGNVQLPQTLFLKFDAPDGCPPVTAMNPGSQQMFPGMSGGSRQMSQGVPPAWMLFGGDYLFFGLNTPQNANSAGSQVEGPGYKAGVWLMPVSQLEPAIAAQKQIQREQEAQAVGAAEQAQKYLLEKYDLNHNGIIDPDEKEAALDDPAFIELELDTIDANHNGWLDAEELVWFDTNQNKILEPKEQAGIEIAQQLFAERLMKKFDAKGDGVLDQSEFNDLVQAIGATSADPRTGSSLIVDKNHDGLIDMGELKTFLKWQMLMVLRSHGMPGANPSGDPRQMFKAEVESYWQRPGGLPNQPPFNNRIPPSAGFVPNRIPQSARQYEH